MLPDFDRAFRTGQRFLSARGQFEVVVTQLGLVDLPSGAVDVVDPLTWDMDPDLSWTPPPPDVSPGAYRVERSDLDDCPIAVRIVLREEAAVAWERWEFSIGVDSGLLMFCDITALVDLSALSDEERPQVEGLPELGGEFALPTASSPLRAVVWPTGADGAFHCLWGLGANGARVCALVDMLGLYDEEAFGATIERAVLVRTGSIEDATLSTAEVSLAVVRADEKQIVLRVDGYDRVRGWHLRRADGGLVKHGRLFRRHEGLLVLDLPEGLPEDASLMVQLGTRLVPMTRVEADA